MVTDQEMKGKYSYVSADEGTSLRVSAAEMRKFNTSLELSSEVADLIVDYVTKNNLKPKYEKLSVILQMSEKQIKNSLNGNLRITRGFLYKLVVGLKIDRESADKLFEKCGGVLKDDCCEDYICMCAIRDGDSVKQFVQDYNKYSEGKPLNIINNVF